MLPRSILLVAHVTPPATMSAARRPAGLTKYLARRGYQVTVLTSVMGGTGPVSDATRTIRTPDLLVSRINWRRKNLAALKGETGGEYAPAPSALGSLLAPDLEIVGWTPFALTRALRLVRATRFDCVLTTSPPRSGHLVGLALQRHGLPWVADFRDGWTFESHRAAWAHPWLESLDGALERVIVQNADAVTAVTEPIAADLRSRFSRPVATVTNGFDPEGLTSHPAGTDGVLSSDRCSLVHTGNLTYGGRPLGPLLDAMRALRASHPDAAQRLEAVLVGPVAPAERIAVEQAGLDGSVRFTGPVPHETALAVQHQADGLLVVTGPGQTGVATGKLFEYLAAGRPILVIGDDTAAARIVEELGAGIALPRDNPPALAAGLRRLVEDPRSLPRASPETVAPYAYPALAERMAEQIEQAIATAQLGSGRVRRGPAARRVGGRDGARRSGARRPRWRRAARDR